jgi:hypothetical protein
VLEPARAPWRAILDLLYSLRARGLGSSYTSTTGATSSGSDLAVHLEALVSLGGLAVGDFDDTYTITVPAGHFSRFGPGTYPIDPDLDDGEAGHPWSAAPRRLFSQPRRPRHRHVPALRPYVLRPRTNPTSRPISPAPSAASLYRVPRESRRARRPRPRPLSLQMRMPSTFGLLPHRPPAGDRDG